MQFVQMLEFSNLETFWKCSWKVIVILNIAPPVVTRHLNNPYCSVNRILQNKLNQESEMF